MNGTDELTTKGGGGCMFAPKLNKTNKKAHLHEHQEMLSNSPWDYIRRLVLPSSVKFDRGGEESKPKVSNVDYL